VDHRVINHSNTNTHTHMYIAQTHTESGAVMRMILATYYGLGLLKATSTIQGCFCFLSVIL